MATVTAQNVDLTGTVLTTAAAATTIDFVVPATASVVFVRVQNGSGSSMTVVIDDPTSLSPANATTFNPDVTVTIATATTKAFKITNLARFKDPSTGKITLTLSATASSTVEVTYA